MNIYEKDAVDMPAESNIFAENKLPRGGLFIRKQDGTKYMQRLRALSRMRTARCGAMKAVKRQLARLHKLENEFLFVLKRKDRRAKRPKMLIAGHHLLVNIFTTVLQSVQFEPFMLDTTNQNEGSIEKNLNNIVGTNENSQEDQRICNSDKTSNRINLDTYNNKTGRETRSSKKAATIIRKRPSSEHTEKNKGNKLFKVENDENQYEDDVIKIVNNSDTAEIEQGSEIHEVSSSQEPYSLGQNESDNENFAFYEQPLRRGNNFLLKKTGTPEMLLQRQKSNRRVIKCKVKRHMKKVLVKLNNDYLFVLREGTLRNYVISGCGTLIDSFLKAYPCVNLKPLYESDAATLDDCLKDRPDRNAIEVISPVKTKRNMTNTASVTNDHWKVSSRKSGNAEPISSQNFSNICEHTEIAGNVSSICYVEHDSELVKSHVKFCQRSNVHSKETSGVSASTYQNKDIDNMEKVCPGENTIHADVFENAEGDYIQSTDLPLLDKKQENRLFIEKQTDEMTCDASCSSGGSISDVEVCNDIFVEKSTIDKSEKSSTHLNRMVDFIGKQDKVKYQCLVSKESATERLDGGSKIINHKSYLKFQDCGNDRHEEKVKKICRFCGSKNLSNPRLNMTKFTYAEEFKEVYDIDVNEEEIHPALLCRGHQIMMERYVHCKKEKKLFKTSMHPLNCGDFKHKSEKCSICFPLPFIKNKKRNIQKEIVIDFTPKEVEVQINSIMECFSQASGSERSEFLECIVDNLTLKEKLSLCRQLGTDYNKPIRKIARSKETQTCDTFVSCQSNRNDFCSLPVNNGAHMDKKKMSRYASKLGCKGRHTKNVIANKGIDVATQTIIGATKHSKRPLVKKTNGDCKAKTKLLNTKQTTSQSNILSNCEMKCRYANGEYVALRNKEGGFYLCKLLQNVFGYTHCYKVFWMEQLLGDLYKMKTTGSIKHDYTCIITHCRVKQVDTNLYELESGERRRIEDSLRNHPKDVYVDFVSDERSNYQLEINKLTSETCLENQNLLPYQKSGEESKGVDEIKIKIGSAFQIKKEIDSAEEVDD